MARLRRAPADEILAVQFLQRAHQRRLRNDPCAIFPDDLVARSVATEYEGIAPLRRPPDVDAGCRRGLPDLLCIQDTTHMLFLSGMIERVGLAEFARPAGGRQLAGFQMMTFFSGSSPGAGA